MQKDQKDQQDRTIDRTTFPFAPHYLDIDGMRMHYVDEGQGEPLVFVHGTPTWSYEWRHIIAAFSPTWRCIAPDHLGFGLSERPHDFAYTPEAHAQMFARFVAALDLDRITLIVHDYGGPIALPFCLDHPHRVVRLIIINSWMWSFSGNRDMELKGQIGGSWFGRFLYRYVNFSLRVLMPYAYGNQRKLTPAIHQHYLDRFPDAWSRGAVLWALARSILGSSAFYDSLWQRRDRLKGHPALILWGMSDRAFQPSMLTQWHEILPEARVVELPGVGHWPHEEAPEQVIHEMKRFLSTGDVDKA